MSTEIGRRAGELMAGYGESLQLAEVIAEGDLDREVQEKRQVRATALEELEELRAVRLELEERRLRLFKVATDLDRSRWEAPQEYSIVRGVFFVALAILLVLADVSIIGQVIARFLNYEWLIGNPPRPFTQVLFTAPWQAFADAPDLLLLSLAVLLIGFFVKAFLDGLTSWKTREPEQRQEETPRLILYGSATVLSLLTLVSMAAARLTLPWGANDSIFAGVVWALLGLSLPLVSAAFFVKGFECLASRSSLTRAGRAAQSALTAAREMWKLERETSARIASLDGEAGAMTEGPQRRGYLAQRRLEFSQGYRQGLSAALEKSGGDVSLFDRLRPLLVETVRKGRE